MVGVGIYFFYSTEIGEKLIPIKTFQYIIMDFLILRYMEKTIQKVDIIMVYSGNV